MCIMKDSKTGETVEVVDSEKTFVDHPVTEMLPEQLTVMQALDRVLHRLLVGSKRFPWLL